MALIQPAGVKVAAFVFSGVAVEAVAVSCCVLSGTALALLSSSCVLVAQK